MATPKQVAANRRNSAKSTGPKTDEGRARARINALKHGLAAEGLVDSTKQSEFDVKLRAWKYCINPVGPVMEFELEVAVMASMQVSESFRHEDERIRDLRWVALIDEERWQLERRLEAAEIGRSLKGNPETVALKLWRLPEGREWLIRAWQQLLACIPEEGDACWTDRESNRMLDLLGEPKENRDVLIKLGPFANWKETREVILGEIELLEMDRGRNELEDLELRREHVRAAASLNDRDLRLIRRYKLEAHKRYEKAMAALGYLRDCQAPEIIKAPLPEAKDTREAEAEAFTSERKHERQHPETHPNHTPDSLPHIRPSVIPNHVPDGLPRHNPDFLPKRSAEPTTTDKPFQGSALKTVSTTLPETVLPSLTAMITGTKPISVLSTLLTKTSVSVSPPAKPKDEDRQRRKTQRQAQKRARKASR